MPTATEIERSETRMTRLLSRVLGDAGPLSRFIAARRIPGPKWQSWEAIGFELRQLTGESITRGGLNKIALRYGIPDTTRNDNIDEYCWQVKAAGITI